jgi:shikimate 5-dehydrogenase
MIRHGVRKIFVRNRTYEKAEEVAKQFNNWSSRDQTNTTTALNAGETDTSGINHLGNPLTMRALEYTEDSWPSDADPPTIVVSSIPGLNTGDRLPTDNKVPSSWLASKTGGVVVELAYDPLETPLLKQAREKSHQGWIAVDGLQVLPEQGMHQFELFTGRRAPQQQMRKAALQGYEEQHKLEVQSRA